MKYWERVADNLKKSGWSLGWVSALDLERRTIWIVDAHRDTESVSLCERMKAEESPVHSSVLPCTSNPTVMIANPSAIELRNAGGRGQSLLSTLPSKLET